MGKGSGLRVFGEEEGGKKGKINKVVQRSTKKDTKMEK